MIKTIGCVECGEAVPYGRLSCPVCGALLASVAGARRRPPTIAVEDVPEPIVAAESEPPQVATSAPIEELANETDVAGASAASGADAVSPDEPPQAEAAAPPEAPQAADAPATSETAAFTETQAPLDSPIETGSSFAPDDPDVPTEAEPEAEVRWAPVALPQPTLKPRPYRRQFVFDRDHDVAPAPPPSAYRPPTIALSAAVAAAPTWPSANPAAVVREAAAPLVASKAATYVRELVDSARFVEIAGWFVIVGATMSVLGLLLPWSRSVIGSSGIGTYFDTWGLASPTHSFVLMGLLAALGLAIVPTKIPAWFRSGVIGLGLGGLLVGLTWPYLFGPLGADVGVTVTVIGGLALLIGGGVASWATRHAEADPPV
jgi:hypothetical protein